MSGVIVSMRRTLLSCTSLVRNGLLGGALAALLPAAPAEAADLIDTLYRGLADNTVGKIIDNLLRADLLIVDEIGFAPLDDTGTQLLFRLVAGAYERRSLAVASHWPFEKAHLLARTCA